LSRAARRSDTEIATKLQALRAPFLELAARGAPVFVDGASVPRIEGSEVHASAVVTGGEGNEAEMARLGLLGDVVPALAPPPLEVLGRDQDAPIGPGSAAGAALQAIQLVGGG
jgi:hypothetical protein